MKKKLKNTKLIKFLLGSPLIRMGIKSIPIVGDIAGQFLDNTEKIDNNKPSLGKPVVLEGSAEGSITKAEVFPIIIRYGILLGLIIYALKTGDWEGAEKGRDLID